MGCGSSTHSSAIGEETNGTKTRNVKAAGVKRGTRPGSKVSTSEDGDDLSTVVLPDSPAKPVKPPLAFEIPLEGSPEHLGTEGLVKRHPPRPPKRLQRLHPSEEPLSLKDLQDKLESAEKRRQMILQKRIASATKASRQATKMLTDLGNESEENDHSPQKSMTEIKNAINIEGHGVPT